MTQPIRISGISGSLRKGSYNTAALRAAQALAPDDMELDIITLEGIEPFNEDVEAEGWPPNVSALRDRVQDADGILIATPEYNYGTTGVLKNAIDWLSRPTGEGPIVGKPVGIIGASPAKTGTARAQAQLRQAAYYNSMPLLPTAEVLISDASERFDDSGRLIDNETREFLGNMLSELGDWVRKHNGN